MRTQTFILKVAREYFFTLINYEALTDNGLLGEPLTTLWDDILSNNLHAEGGVDFPKGKKPEGLVKRILNLRIRSPGDWVLDSFAGSGTTGAVAHKMGRRWIMVELGEHCHTHIIPRLKKVIDGEDPAASRERRAGRAAAGSATIAFRAVSARKGQVGQLGHQQGIQRRHAGRGLCKLEGFQYAPERYGLLAARPFHERDFIYVTTQHLSRDQLEQLE